MKKHLVLSLAGLMSVAGLALGQQKKQSGLATVQLQLAQCALKVSGMTHHSCATAVKKGLRKVEGVKDAMVEWKTGDAKVDYDPAKTTPQRIVETFNKNSWGYRAELAKSNTK